MIVCLKDKDNKIICGDKILIAVGGEPIKPNILKDLEKDRSNYALLQNKENMFIFINKMHRMIIFS